MVDSLSLGLQQGFGKGQTSGLDDALHSKTLAALGNGPSGTDGSGSAGEVLSDFGNVFKQQINQVNELTNQSNTMMKQFALGEGTDLHSVMIASEKAQMAMEFTMQLRNKMVQAYQEISRMNL